MILQRVTRPTSEKVEELKMILAYLHRHQLFKEGDLSMVQIIEKIAEHEFIITKSSARTFFGVCGLDRYVGNIDDSDRKNRLFDMKPPLLGTRIAVISETVGGNKVFMVKEVHWNCGADDRKILAYTIQPARSEIFQPMEKVKVANGNPHKTLFKWLEDLCVLNDEHELEVTITHGLSSVENTYRHNLNDLFLNKDDEIQHVNEEVPLVMNIMKDRNYAVNDFKVIRNRPDGDAELIGRLILNFTDEGFVPHVLFPR